ncbi:hypothetical protein RRG08_016871 [Elysia crispata]|uniref:Uncharacterized protein n=1 Tax=Elysia crispata TaxID=231223 RepID=A0AAE1CIQ1_9GAST|nr:hypothetical protein RRG08_016871 [Elysia crispata]
MSRLDFLHNPVDNGGDLAEKILLLKSQTPPLAAVSHDVNEIFKCAILIITISLRAGEITLRNLHRGRGSLRFIKLITLGLSIEDEEV